MDKTPFFSIVVPACDVAPFGAEMIDSLRQQSDGDFEALIVCEESADGTLEVLRRAIGDEPRFIVTELPRSGSASAGRNYGIEHAHGQYLLFLDGDDLLKPEALEIFRHAIATFGEIDLIAGRAEVRWELNSPARGAEQLAHPIECGKVFPAPLALARMMERRFMPAVWYQIYRRELIKNDATLRQPIGRRHQDEQWTPRVFLAAKTFAAIPEVFYVYRKRANSVTTKSNPKSIRDITDNLLDFFKYWHARPIPPEARAAVADWYIDLFFRYFSRNSARQFSYELRRQEFRRLVGAPENFRTYREMARLSRFSRRILIPLIGLARRPGGFVVSEKLFQWFYWPLVHTIWGALKTRLRHG